MQSKGCLSKIKDLPSPRQGAAAALPENLEDPPPAREEPRHRPSKRSPPQANAENSAVQALVDASTVPNNERDPLVPPPAAVQSPVPGVPNEESREYRSDPEDGQWYDLQSFLETYGETDGLARWEASEHTAQQVPLSELAMVGQPV
ncbi:hypothetical protein DIPPA_02042 [Diplonema papillatum]|nr:hypothetical protein DIPPA_02042 [Diplonema papillatum]